MVHALEGGAVLILHIKKAKLGKIIQLDLSHITH